MNAIIRRMNAFLAVRKQGSGLILALSLLSYLMILSMTVQLNLKSIVNMKKYDAEYEAFEISLFQRIKKDFYNMKNEDFEIDNDDIHAQVYYLEDSCDIVITTDEFVREIHIEYDPIYLCIASIEYETESIAY